MNALYDDPIGRDPEPVDGAPPPELLAVSILSGGVRLIGSLFLTQGAGPHPTIVLMHGFPGYEKNYDLAHIFRRAGYNVLVFHYRGAWGSEGAFRFAHVLEDVQAALRFLKSAGEEALQRVDPGRIVLAGASTGGFAALMAAAAGADVHAVASFAGFNFGLFADLMREREDYRLITLQTLQAALHPIRGSSAEELLGELLDNSKRWNLIDHAPALIRYPVLLLAGSRDQVAFPDVHHAPLVQALTAHRAERLTHQVLDADHTFSAKRIALARTILGWLKGLEAEGS